MLFHICLFPMHPALTTTYPSIALVPPKTSNKPQIEYFVFLFILGFPSTSLTMCSKIQTTKRIKRRYSPIPVIQSLKFD